MNKTQMAQAVLERIDWIDGLKRSDVSQILDAVGEVMIEALNAADEGETVPVIPTFVSIRKTWKPAKRARKGINPFTGEEQMFKAKAASWSVKARALKKVKDGMIKKRRR